MGQGGGDMPYNFVVYTVEFNAKKKLTSLDTGETGGEWQLLTPGSGGTHFDSNQQKVHKFSKFACLNPFFSQ